MRTENVIPDFAKYDGGENFTYKNIIYTKKECLGKGAYGEVFRFEANTPSSPSSNPSYLAVKSELPRKQDGKFINGEEFRNDAHWNQVVSGLGILSGNPSDARHARHVLMSYVEGETLNKIQMGALLDMISLWMLVASAFDDLHKTHRAVHSDIKANNVIMSLDRKKATPIDFGLTVGIGNTLKRSSVRQRERSLHIAGELFGSGETSAQITQDIFSLGMLLSYLLQKTLTTNSNALKYLKKHYDALTHRYSVMRPSIMKVNCSLYEYFFSKIPSEPAPIPSEPVTQKHKAIENTNKVNNGYIIQHINRLEDNGIELTATISHALRTYKDPTLLATVLIYLKKRNIEITDNIIDEMVEKNNPKLYATILVAEAVIKTYQNSKKNAGFFSMTGASSDCILTALKELRKTGDIEKILEVAKKIPGARLTEILLKQNVLDNRGHLNECALICQ